jgi:hypothetical protein
MTELLQTRLPRDTAVRFKAAARAEGKSVYQALRELAEGYAQHGSAARFACVEFPERFALPPPERVREELRARIRRRHEKHH